MAGGSSLEKSITEILRGEQYQDAQDARRDLGIIGSLNKHDSPAKPVMQPSPPSIEDQFEKRKQRYERVEGQLYEIPRLTPEKGIQVLDLIDAAREAYTQDKNAAAFGYMERASTMVPYEPTVCFRYARWLAVEGRHIQALRLYEQTNAMYEGSSVEHPARVGVIYMLVHLERFDEAKRYFEMNSIDESKLGERDLRHLFMARGYCYFRSRDWDAAELELSRLQSLTPHDRELKAIIESCRRNRRIEEGGDPSPRSSQSTSLWDMAYNAGASIREAIDDFFGR
jgi:tetratricopeptide (TPR) repeat protein